jgi:hypothetical protein
MKDHNDFFDDMIDVDDEIETNDDAEAEEYFDEGEAFGDEEENDEDEAAEVRTALLTKNEMLALISLRTTESGGQIVRVDPRESLPSVQRYESEGEAVKWFTRSLSTSRRNGWSVVYDGEPMIG